MITNRTRIARIIVYTLGALMLTSANVSAALIKSYDFDSDLTDTLGNGNVMTASGGSLATPGRYAFSFNQGLRLMDALPNTANYAIEMKFQVNSSQGQWKKLIDFSDLSGGDLGLYIRNTNGANNLFNDKLAFFNVGDTWTDPLLKTTIPGDTDVVVTLTRDSATEIVTGFVNGVEQWNFDDTTFDFAVPPGNILNFFHDDNSGSESFGGSVDYIRIFDSTDTTIPDQNPDPKIPEPGTLAIFGLGLAGLGYMRRRQAA